MKKVFLLASTLAVAAGQQCSVQDSSKIDCGHVGTTQAQCLASNCCWEPSTVSGIPWCFYPAGTNVCTFDWSSSGVPFSSAALSAMQQYYFANLDIDGQGGVCASPDTNTPDNGSYYYNWERDASLGMRALLTNFEGSQVQTFMQSWVKWVLHVQSEPDPNGIDVRIEPKYLLPNGTVYPGGWCRPQTDGPALRATTLMMYADQLIQNGQQSYVSQYLWTGNPSVYNGGAIKWDLDWVVSNWQSSGCDLWENVQSNDFFWNRLSFAHALSLGATFAGRMGDSVSAVYYAQQANAINATLSNHWNGAYIYESTNRQKDSAVIIAINRAWNNNPLFSPLSEWVASTVNTLNILFCTTFPINNIDTKAGVPGILWGRFQGDVWVGGNPWILTTANFAELLYKASVEVLQTGFHDQGYTVWATILNVPTTSSPQEWATAFANAGDAVLTRLNYHVESGQWHLSEQLSKTNGQSLSAYDLTWSYASVFNAMSARAAAYELLENAIA